MAAASELSSSSKDRRKKKTKAFQVGDSIIGEDEITLIGAKPLGGGMFGQVWKGECRGTECAVKIPTKPRLSPSQLRVFQEEMDIMKKISNPHCCLFMGASFNEKTTRLQIVTELCSGDMNSLILEDKRNFPLSQRLLWATQAARGLTWLHNLKPQPILHRDLKLANLLFDADMNVKVADFGLSQITEGGKEVWEKRPRGSLLYMAPEVYLQNNPISDKTDVHSFAMVLWEFCTRKEVYEEYYEPQLFIKDAFVNGKRPETLARWPKSLQDLLQAMWHPEPAQRPLMKDVVKALEGIHKEVVREEHVQEVFKRVKDNAGQKFWIENYLGQKSVPWDQFSPLFFKYLQIELPSVTAECIENGLTNEQRQFACLRDVLISKDGKVSLIQFGKVIAWFGALEIPYKDGGFLDRIVGLLCKTYFHGPMTSGEAEKLLCVRNSGHFVVRFSGRTWGGYTISVVTRETTLKHCIVFHDSDKGFRLDRNADKYWPTLPQLISDHSDSLWLQYPVGGSPYSYLFATKPTARVLGYQADYDDGGADGEELLLAAASEN